MWWLTAHTVCQQFIFQHKPTKSWGKKKMQVCSRQTKLPISYMLINRKLGVQKKKIFCIKNKLCSLALFFCPHIFYSHSTEEPNNLNFEKSELRNVRCKQQASVLTNRGFVWEICCVTGFSSLSVYVLAHICWDNRTTGQDRRARYFTWLTAMAAREMSLLK